MFLFRFLFLLSAGASVVFAQDDAGRQVTLDRETIDAIAAKASPTCRSELEAALEYQAEISSECKQEIHSILLTLTDKFSSTGPSDEPSETKAVPSAGGIHPGVWIAVFLVCLVAAVAAYVVYVNRLLAESGIGMKSPKTLSKKKLEKLKMKGKA